MRRTRVERGEPVKAGDWWLVARTACALALTDTAEQAWSGELDPAVIVAEGEPGVTGIIMPRRVEGA